MEVIVKPDVYERYYNVLRNCFLLIVEGTVQEQSGILNVLAEEATGGSEEYVESSSLACIPRLCLVHHKSPGGLIGVGTWCRA